MVSNPRICFGSSLENEGGDGDKDEGDKDILGSSDRGE